MCFLQLLFIPPPAVRKPLSTFAHLLVSNLHTFTGNYSSQLTTILAVAIPQLGGCPVLGANQSFIEHALLTLSKLAPTATITAVQTMFTSLPHFQALVTSGKLNLEELLQILKKSDKVDRTHERNIGQFAAIVKASLKGL